MLTFIGIYLFSALMFWLWIHKAYSKGGIWSNINPESVDLFIMFFPLLNTIALVLWVFNYPAKEHHDYYDKFFRIKK